MPANLESILKLEVPIIVQIARLPKSVSEVMGMAPGTILELPKGADEELEILVNNKPIGLGTAVKVGENFGIRVTYVGDVRERIAAMGEPQPRPASGDSAEGEAGGDSHQESASQRAVDV